MTLFWIGFWAAFSLGLWRVCGWLVHRNEMVPMTQPKSYVLLPRIAPPKDPVIMTDQVRRQRLQALIEIQRYPADRVVSFDSHARKRVVH